MENPTLMKQVLLSSTKLWLFRLVILLSYLHAATNGSAQGLFKEYTFNQTGFQGKYIEELPDGNYRMVLNTLGTYYGSGAFNHLILTVDPEGTILDSQQVNFTGQLAFWLKDMTFLQSYKDWTQGDSSFQFTKTNLQKDTLWTTPFTLPTGSYAVEWMHAELDTAGNIWVAGVWFNAIPNNDFTRLVLMKLSSDGQLLWQKIFPTNSPNDAISEPTVKFRITPDQGCILKYFASSTTVLRVDAAGEVLWQKTLPTHTLNGLTDFQVRPDNRSLLVGNHDFAKLISLDSAGNILFIKAGPDFLPGGGEDPIAVIATQDGNWVVAGIRAIGFDNSLFTAKLSASGDILWTKKYQIKPGAPVSGCETINKDLIWTGGPPFLIRMDSNGLIFKNHLAGRLAHDPNVDCLVQAGEPEIPRWLIKLENTGATQYAVSEPDGTYYFAQVDTGQQALTPIIQNYLWESCQLPYTGYIHPDSSDYTLQLDAPIQSIFDCPVMSVDLAAPRLRRCFNNTYAIQCCNYGNQAADSAYVELYLPPHLLVQSASAPFMQNDLTLRFELGAVEPFECIDIQLVVKPDCDSTEIGQAICVSAHIFPDTLCGPVPGWSGALIEVSAACDSDSVRFDIRNTGTAPTSQPLDFIVIDDHVMTLQSSFNLAAKASHTEAFPADGSTWRLLAKQEPNAPGAPVPSVAVEGCLAGGTGPFNTGFIIQWPNENGSPFWERDCHEIVGSYDPNDKQAAPAGVDAQHWIKPNTPIKYLIRFQNTGTDTAFTVELRDTLSPWLKPESIRPGASSHPYSWSLSSEGVSRFLFENILLPDSTTNEPGSQGFVQFHIEQQVDLPDGTLLQNSAAIYFDFNEPVRTNTTFHIVGRDFLPTVSVNPKPTPAENILSVFPNPARDRVVVFLKNKNRLEGRLTLFDAYGREVWTEPVNSAIFELQRRGLPAGLYHLQWEKSDRSRGFAKVVWK